MCQVKHNRFVAHGSARSLKAKIWHPSYRSSLRWGHQTEPLVSGENTQAAGGQESKEFPEARCIWRSFLCVLVCFGASLGIMIKFQGRVVESTSIKNFSRCSRVCGSKLVGLRRLQHNCFQSSTTNDGHIYMLTNIVWPSCVSPGLGREYRIEKTQNL